MSEPFSPVELERRLTQFFADAAEMEIETEIFRGPLPSDKADAVGVMLNGDTRDNTPSMWRYDAQILGRYRNRDQAAAVSEKLWSLLPHYSADMVILRVGSAAVYHTKWNSVDVWGLSLNLSVSAR